MREQQVDAERVLEALDSALATDADQLLSEDEKTTILLARQALADVKDKRDIKNIEQAIKHLEAVCEDYVARRMNTNIKNAMQGHSIEEYASDASSDAEVEES